MESTMFDVFSTSHHTTLKSNRSTPILLSKADMNLPDPIPPFPIFPIPNSLTTLKFLAPKR